METIRDCIHALQEMISALVADFGGKAAILLVQELPDELFVLDVPVVQRLDEVLLEDVLELSKLVVLCLLQVLQLAAKAFFQLDQLVAMK